MKKKMSFQNLKVFLSLILMIAGTSSLWAQSCASSANIYTFKYNGNKYEIVKELKTWKDAASCAVQRGGHLVHIESQAEQDTVYSSIINGAKVSKTYTSISDGGGIAYLWIGGTDNRLEGTWKWDGDDNIAGTIFWKGNNTGSAQGGAYVNWGGHSKGSFNEPDDYGSGQDAAGIALNGWPSGTGALGVESEWNDIAIGNYCYYIIEHECKLTYASFSVVICEGDSFLVGDKYQKTSGSYKDTIQNYEGCDSLRYIKLIVDPAFDSAIVSICKGDSIWSGGSYKSSKGIYYDTIKTTNGCEQIFKTDLSVNPTYQQLWKPQICKGDSLFTGARYIMDAGVYLDSFKTVHGCDSILTTTLVVNSSFRLNLNYEICEGDSMLILNKYRKKSGVFLDSLKTFKGCDSIYEIALQVNHSYSINKSYQICDGDSILLAGKYRYQSGTYYDSLHSVKACDSIIVYHLYVSQVFKVYDERRICMGDSIELGGQYRKVAGTYYDTLSSYMFCDSIVISNLTVNNPFLKYDSLSICDGEVIDIHGYQRSEAGTYFDTLHSYFGCDSVFVTELNVTEIDTALIVHNNSLEVTMDADHYSWLNCDLNELVQDEHSKLFTPENDGHYAAIIQLSDCSDITACYYVKASSVPGNERYGYIDVYPVPARDFLLIRFHDEQVLKAVLYIYDSKGRQVCTEMLIGEQLQKISLEGWKSGIYFGLLHAENHEVLSFRFMIEK